MQPLGMIGRRYELLAVIGRGGMATVFRAFDHRMCSTVAVKVLNDTYTAYPTFIARFQREALAAATLRHPNVVQVFDCGESGGRYFIAMELIQGSDLHHYLRHAGRLDNARAIEIAYRVALGLGAAHRRGIVHRDVKPANILLRADGRVKLTDFGVASVQKGIHDPRLTSAGIALGTSMYSSPEQSQGKDVQPAADVYALGVVVYEMLCGQVPFEADSPAEAAIKHVLERPTPPRRLNRDIAPALEKLVLRCLEKNPRHRYADGDALASALEQVALATNGRRLAVESGAAAVNGVNGSPDAGAPPPAPVSPRDNGIAELETTLLSPHPGTIADQEIPLPSPHPREVGELETVLLSPRESPAPPPASATPGGHDGGEWEIALQNDRGRQQLKAQQDAQRAAMDVD